MSVRRRRANAAATRRRGRERVGRRDVGGRAGWCCERRGAASPRARSGKGVVAERVPHGLVEEPAVAQRDGEEHGFGAGPQRRHVHHVAFDEPSSPEQTSTKARIVVAVGTLDHAVVRSLKTSPGVTSGMEAESLVSSSPLLALDLPALPSRQPRWCALVRRLSDVVAPVVGQACRRGRPSCPSRQQAYPVEPPGIEPWSA